MKYIQSSAQLELGYIEVLKTLCREHSSVYSRKCLRELNRSFVRFDRLKLDLRSYASPTDMILDRTISGMLTKCPSIPTLEDPEQNCLDTFNRFEAQCLETNKRIASGGISDPDVNAVMFTARRKIAHILGDVPEITDLGFTYGPGATRNVRSRTSAFNKIIAEPETTLENRANSLRLLSSVPRLWTLYGGTETCLPTLKIVPGSRFGQVPKSATTNRPIDIEPTLNGVLQRGYGSSIRRRLAKFGNRISDGQERHAELARYASVMKTYATIDFSGASDSIASMLVLDLLPYDWFDALDNCRSHRHFINDEWKNLQKFSSMGNGFTFELETLIFLALARSCCDVLGIAPTLVSVYGDDVIIPDDAVDLFFKVSAHCGFTVNEEKSFWGSDAFRESCGSDWMDGVDVRTAYLRNVPSPHYLSTLHNRLVFLGIDSLIPATMAALRLLVPSEFRRLGPPSSHMYGYLHSWEHYGSRPVKAVRFVPRKHLPEGRAVLAYALYTSQLLSPDYLVEHAARQALREPVERAYGVLLQDFWVEQDREFTLCGKFDAPMTMERFTVRRDFKLSSVAISATGMTSPPKGPIRKFRLSEFSKRLIVEANARYDLGYVA